MREGCDMLGEVVLSRKEKQRLIALHGCFNFCILTAFTRVAGKSSGKIVLPEIS